MTGFVCVRACRAQEVFGGQLLSNATAATLVLTVQTGKTMFANKNYTVSFSLQNSAEKQVSPSVSIRVGGDYPSALQQMEKLDTMRHPLLVAGFEVKSIRQSDPSTDVVNIITVSLRASAHLLEGTYVTIHGIRGTQTPDDDALALMGPFLATFGSQAAWRQAPGKLVVRLQARLNLGQDYELSFRVRNPRHRIADPPNITIEARNNQTLLLEGHPADVLAYKAGVLAPNAGSRAYIDNATICTGASAPAACVERSTVRVGVDMALTGMLPANFTARVLKIIDLLYVSIRQTTVSAGLLNNLTLVINPEEKLFYPYQVVTVHGLTGSATPSGYLPIDSSYASGGNFSQDTGMLVFALDADVPRTENHTFTLELRNGLRGQEAPTVSVELGKTAGSPPYLAWTATRRNASVPQDFHVRPLQIAYFATKLIGQSSPVGGASNTLTVTLAPRVYLSALPSRAGPAAITISSLSNAVHRGASIQLVEVGEHASGCGGNCSAFFSDSPGGAAGYGRWRNATGNESLVLYLLKPLEALQTYKIAFTVTNPTRGQASPDVEIEADGSNSRIARDVMRKAGGDNDPLVVAGFKIARIGQSTISQGALNRLSITLAPFTTLPKGLTLTLSGMHGGAHPETRAAGLAYTGVLPIGAPDQPCGLYPHNLSSCRLLFESPVAFDAYGFPGGAGTGLWHGEPQQLTCACVPAAWSLVPSNPLDPRPSTLNPGRRGQDVDAETG